MLRSSLYRLTSSGFKWLWLSAQAVGEGWRMASSIIDGINGVSREIRKAVDAASTGSKQQSDSSPVIHVGVAAGKPSGIVSLVCPRCNANVQIVDGGKANYCSYCGTALLVDDGSTTVTYRTVDEAKIKQAETRELLELKRLEIEERRRPLRLKAMAAMAVFGVLALLIGSFAGAATGDGGSGPWMVVKYLGMFSLIALAYVWLILFAKDYKDKRNDD